VVQRLDHSPREGVRVSHWHEPPGGHDLCQPAARRRDDRFAQRQRVKHYAAQTLRLRGHHDDVALPQERVRPRDMTEQVYPVGEVELPDLRGKGAALRPIPRRSPSGDPAGSAARRAPREPEYADPSRAPGRQRLRPGASQA